MYLITELFDYYLLFSYCYTWYIIIRGNSKDRKKLLPCCVNRYIYIYIFHFPRTNTRNKITAKGGYFESDQVEIFQDGSSAEILHFVL